MEQIQTLLDKLKGLELTPLEQSLLEVNIKLSKIPDKPQINLQFVRDEGLDGIKRVINQVYFRISLINFFAEKIKIDGNCITINRFS